MNKDEAVLLLRKRVHDIEKTRSFIFAEVLEDGSCNSVFLLRTTRTLV